MSSLKLKHATGNGTILHSPAANPSSDVTLKLPSTTGSAGQVLKVASANHSATNAELEFGTDTGGKLLQVIQSLKTNQNDVTGSNGAFQNIPGTDQSGSGSVFCVKITPSSTSSKILFKANIYAASGESGGASPYCAFRLMRNSTPIAISTAASGSAINATFKSFNSDGVYEGQSCQFDFLDSPGLASEITYKVQVGSYQSRVVEINGPFNLDTSDHYSHGCVSNLIVMEIGA